MEVSLVTDRFPSESARVRKMPPRPSPGTPWQPLLLFGFETQAKSVADIDEIGHFHETATFRRVPPGFTSRSMRRSM